MVDRIKDEVLQKDLYGLLGVEKDASPDEIKKEYRKLAFKFHPDRNPNTTGGRFKEVKDAYEILSNGELRMQYDAGRQREQRPAGGFSSGGSDFDDILDRMREKSRRAQEQARATRQRAQEQARRRRQNYQESARRRRERARSRTYSGQNISIVNGDVYINGRHVGNIDDVDGINFSDVRSDSRNSIDESYRVSNGDRISVSTRDGAINFHVNELSDKVMFQGMSSGKVEYVGDGLKIYDFVGGLYLPRDVSLEVFLIAKDSNVRGTLIHDSGIKTNDCNVSLDLRGDMGVDLSARDSNCSIEGLIQGSSGRYVPPGSNQYNTQRNLLLDVEDSNVKIEYRR